MKKLFWLEWFVSRQGILIGVILTILFFFTACTGKGGEYYLYSLPSFIVISILVRSAVKFDKDGIDKLFMLLPIKIKSFVGVKYLFYNGLLLISALGVSGTYLILTYFDMLPKFNLTFLLTNLLFGFVLVNLALLGYYLLGAANMQFLMLGGYLAAFWFSKQLVEVALRPVVINILPVVLICLAWCFYKLVCIYLSINPFGASEYLRNTFHIKERHNL